jgi:thiol-disulfide isomerase/thioredoxin
MPLVRVAALCSAVLMLPLICAAQDATPPAATAAPAPAKPAYLSDPKFISAMAEARDLERRREYLFAVDGYKKANKLAGGGCFNCLDKALTLQLALGSSKDAIATASQMESIATSPLEKSLAASARGKAILAQAGDKPKPAQLDAAHQAFQAALTSYPKNTAARYHDACVLARMGKDDEASKEFADCADMASARDPMTARARHFAEDPKLSLNKMAPAFEVNALDGTHFNLDNMGGKVVLIDFWATWCGPCNAELPHMKKIAKEFAEEPLVVISISWDSDEQKWKDFISKNEMTWLQYRDANHELSKRFGVEAIPHYFTIDSDGVLTAEMMGSGSDVEGKLKKLIKRAKESAPPKTQTATLQTHGN